MPIHVSSTCVHHQDVKIALQSLWYHQTYRWPSRAQVERGLQSSLNLCKRRPPIGLMIPGGFVMQFWPPDDEYVCSKHVEVWNKLIVKQKFCASSWLITEINWVSQFCLLEAINDIELSSWSTFLYEWQFMCDQVMDNSVKLILI